MWARLESGAIAETIISPRQISVGEINYPSNIFDLWSEAELAALGIVPLVYEPEPPEGNYAVASESAPVYDAANARAVITRTYEAVPEPVPPSVLKLPFVRALRQKGFEAAFWAALEEDATAKLDFSLANEIDRSDPKIPQFAAAIGASDADVDEVFRLAATL
jgi:hypothetical protein